MNTLQTMALAMLLGSIPFKRIFERRHVHAGEKEPQISEKERALAAALNAVKVGVPVFLAARFLEPKFAVIACVIGVISSCFPYWLMFKPQGYGLDALLGGFMGLNPLAGICALAVWAGVLLVADRFSVAAISAAICAPILLKLFHAPDIFLWFAIFACAYVIVAHSANIPRLIDGSEPHWKRTNDL